MCFIKPSPPLSVAPVVPNPDDDAVRMRQQQELATQSQQSGTLATIHTPADLDPAKLVGQRKVLLGQ